MKVIIGRYGTKGLHDNIFIKSNTTCVEKKALRIRVVSTTFLIPEKLLSRLENRLTSSNLDLENYLKKLLIRYSENLDAKNIIPSNSLTTLYQAPNQNLIRMNIRLHADVWQSLRIFARGMGISMCLLVTLLLLLDNESNDTNLSREVTHTPLISQDETTVEIHFPQYYYYEVVTPPPTRRIRGLMCI